MQKLLIVIAIQFCLPLLAYGIQKWIPWNWVGSLDGLVVVIATVGVGNMLGLLRPRWKWMLSASALILGYWAIWLELKLFELHRTTSFPISDSDYRWYFLKILLQLLSVNFVFGIILSRYLQLVLLNQREKTTPTQLWQFHLRDMLYLTALCAGLAVTAAFRFQSTDIFENFLGLFGQGDTICMLTALATFYLLLWQNWRWRWIVLGLFYISTFLLSIYSDYSSINVTQLDQQIQNFSIFLLAIISMLLYRWAGLRIVWRKSEPLPNTLQSTGQL